MSKTQQNLEILFHGEMLNIYEEARQLNPPYHATRFRQLVLKYGGKDAADRLLATSTPSEGFTELFLHDGRLDLSVEYLVLREPYRQLFTPDQLAVARGRLQELNFPPPPEDDQ